MTQDRVEHLICHKLKHFRSLPKATQALRDGKSPSATCYSHWLPL
jgi:hypothetical protein